VRTFAANLPKKLIDALERANLLQVRRVIEKSSGMHGTEYYFTPGAYKYIVKFFEETTP
jgi:hypothetical protein